METGTVSLYSCARLDWSFVVTVLCAVVRPLEALGVDAEDLPAVVDADTEALAGVSQTSKVFVMQFLEAGLWTACFVMEHRKSPQGMNGAVHGWGLTRCSFHDTFDAWEGRRVALERALASARFRREESEQVWREFTRQMDACKVGLT